MTILSYDVKSSRNENIISFRYGKIKISIPIVRESDDHKEIKKFLKCAHKKQDATFMFGNKNFIRIYDDKFTIEINDTCATICLSDLEMSQYRDAIIGLYNYYKCGYCYYSDSDDDDIFTNKI